MNIRIKVAAALLLSMTPPVAAKAQGFVGGARDGYDNGDRVAGPIGGLVGGAIGAGVGTVRGALGIDARPEPAVYVPAGETNAPHYRRHLRHYHRRIRRHS